MNVAKGALMEISSRLRDRILRPANAAAHPGPIGHFQGFPTPANFSVRGPRPSGMIGSGSSVSYDHLKVYLVWLSLTECLIYIISGLAQCTVK